MDGKIILSILSHILGHSLVPVVQAGTRLLLSVMKEIRRLIRKSVSLASHLTVFRLPALCLA